MKKLFLFVIVLFLLFPISRPANAATPAPTPDPCSPDAPLSAPCPVHYDTTNVVIPQSQTWISSLMQNISQLIGQKILNWSGSISPANNTYTAAKNLPLLGQQLQQSSENDLKPAALQAITTPDLQPKPFTMTSVLCIKDPTTGALQQSASPDRIESKDIPGLTQTIEGSRQLGAYVTGHTQVSQDYNLKNIVVATNQGGCDSLSSGQNIDQTPLPTQNQTSFTGSSIVTIVESLISKIQGLFQAKVTQTAEIQGKALTPWIHYPLCLFSGCTTSDTASVSYDTDKNKQELTQAGGAVAAMYKPADIDDTYKSDLNAANPDQQWNISMAGNTSGNVQGAQNVTETSVNFGQARIIAAGTYMNCTLMPADYQGTAVPDGACNKNWVGKTSSCNSAAKLPDAPSSACGLCNKDKIKDMADDKTATVPEGIPPTMETILTKAGEAYHVPPSSLLAIMYHEGAFSGKRFVGDNAWTEANVQKWSTCGQMPNCNENGSTAQFPYGFFPVYFKEFQDAVLVDDPSRKGNTSICNFMDVTYAAAKAMGALAKAPMSSRINITEPLCFNRPMNITKSPASCTDWSEDLVLKTHVFYGSYCPQSSIIQKRTSQGLLSKNEIAQDHFAAWTLNWYNAFLCK